MNVHRTRWTSIRRPKSSLGRPVTSTGQPQPSRGRSLGGRSRDCFDWSPFTPRPWDVHAVLCLSQSECDPTVTHYGEIVGRPRVVQNRKLTFPCTSWCRGFSQSENGLSMTDRDTLQTGVWLSPGRPKQDIDHGYLLSQPIRVHPVTVWNRKLIFLKTSRGWSLAEFCRVFFLK